MTIGAAISLVALAASFIVVPLARRWSEREDAIRLSGDRVARLRGLAERQGVVVNAASAGEATMSAMPTRALRGRTEALAASELQRVLQDYARESRVSVTRLDVAASDRDADSLSLGGAPIPASVAAVTDIYGLADLLGRIQHGPFLMEVTELNVTANAVLRGDLLQVSLALRAPFVVTP